MVLFPLPLVPHVFLFPTSFFFLLLPSFPGPTGAALWTSPFHVYAAVPEARFSALKSHQYKVCHTHRFKCLFQCICIKSQVSMICWCTDRGTAYWVDLRIKFSYSLSLNHNWKLSKCKEKSFSKTCNQVHV